MRLHVHWHRFVDEKGAHVYYECRCGHRRSRALNRHYLGPIDRSWLDHETDELHRYPRPSPRHSTDDLRPRKPRGPSAPRPTPVSSAAAWSAARSVPTYPYEDGDVLVLGPECFVSKDRSVISWRGENYVSSGVGP